MMEMANIIKDWATNSHARRRPSHLVRSGTGSSSMSGAHTNLKEYPNAAQLKKVMAVRVISASPNHSDKLEKISRIGIPAENPRKNIIIARRSANIDSACPHPENNDDFIFY